MQSPDIEGVSSTTHFCYFFLSIIAKLHAKLEERLMQDE
jgi:hypothetical protein